LGRAGLGARCTPDLRDREHMLRSRRGAFTVRMGRRATGQNACCEGQLRDRSDLDGPSRTSGQRRTATVRDEQDLCGDLVVKRQRQIVGKAWRAAEEMENGSLFWGID